MFINSKNIKTLILSCLFLAALPNAYAQLFFDEPDLLKVHEAFPAIIDAADGKVQANFTVAEGYYLYQHAFKFSSPDGVQFGEIEIPAGIAYVDDFFGEVETYRQAVTVSIPVTNIPAGLNEFIVEISSQGCADLGVCYPPYTQDGLVQVSQLDNLTAINSGTSNTVGLVESEQQSLANRLASGQTVLTLLAFFGLGLLLAFTPCVFPMIPILASIIAGQKDTLTTGKAFRLSLTYVLAMAVTYTVAGVFVGLSGENIQALFQTPWILYSFAVLFVLLSLSMFGLYELQMPAFIQNKLNEVSNQQQGGTYIGAGIMGLLSALIVGPCVTAPLIGALLYIAQTGDAVLGGAALFMLSMGMGTPLLVIGTTASKWLPKAGAWMDAVKGFFGVMLLGIAIWMLDRVVPAQVTLLLVGLLSLGTAVFMGALNVTNERPTGLAKLNQLVSVVLLGYGVIALIGVLSGGKSLLEPLKHLAGNGSGIQEKEHALPFEQIKGLAGLEQAVSNAEGRYVMLDFYADWCVSCKEMEAFTFPKDNVQAALNGFVFLQADVTDNDDLDQELLKTLGLVGPPAILFYDKQGTEHRPYRVVGYAKADKFAAHVNQFVAAN